MRTAARTGSRAATSWLLAGAGVALLVSRAALASPPVALLALVYASIAAGSIAVSSDAGPGARLHPAAVLATGLLAVALAALVAGAPPPAPRGAFVVGLALNVGAAVAEEAFFRRLLYGRVLRFGAAAAIVSTAVAFALVHVPNYGAAVFWVDLGAGLVFGWQRWASGSWTAPAATHAVANVLAAIR